MRKGWVLSGLMLALLSSGCSTPDGGLQGLVPDPRVRTLTVVEPAAAQLAFQGDSVDTVDVEGFDSTGALIFGPVRVPLSPEMRLPNVPLGTVRLQFDYLRNGGFMLFRAEASLSDQDVRLTPLAQLVTPNDSELQIVADPAGARLRRIITGSTPSGAAQPRAEVAARAEDSQVQEYRIKGVCYSPSPINFSNKSAPAVGDLFWDSFKAGPDDIFGWAALFLNFYDPNIGQSRGDLDKMRALGVNTVRLYSCISYHLSEDGGFPDQSSAQRFTHKAFLDACWDHGSQRSLGVLVDIPMPDICFRYTLKEALDQPAEQREAVKARRAQEIAWWESNFRATVEDLSQHPAVIGFNIMNEQDGADWSHPGQGSGPDNQETQYFYAQSKKYADLVKQVDSSKLCGWAFHDSPDLVIFGSQFPSSGPKYLEQLSSFDYWGINSYQTRDFFAVVGSGARGSYGDLPESMKKPVLLTELGWPSTGHDDQGQLVDNPSTQAKTAEKVRLMFPQVYQQPLMLGACFFEFSDEWWKQPQGTDATWDPGNPEPSFPNGYWDEEGFGLYSTRRQGGRPNDDLNFITFGPDPKAAFGSKGPKMPYDAYTARTPVIQALTEVFQQVQP